MRSDSSSGNPADLSLINSVDELHAGNDIGHLPEPSKFSPALLCTHGQLMHQSQSAIDAVAISSLGRSESDGGKRRLDRIGCSQVPPMISTFLGLGCENKAG